MNTFEYNSAHQSSLCHCITAALFFLQGLQKGSVPHATGSNTEGTLSHPQTPNSTAPVHPNNQVGHSTNAPSPRQQAHNHLPSPPSLPPSSTSGGAAAGASATKDSNTAAALATAAATLGNGGSESKVPSPLPSADGKTPQADGLANHVHSGDGGKAAEGGEKQSLSADNPRLSALLAGGKGPEEGEGPSEGTASTASATPESHKKVNNIHPAALPSTPHAQGSSAASSPISAMSTATPSPKSSEHTQTGAHSPSATTTTNNNHTTTTNNNTTTTTTTTTPTTTTAPAVNGNGKGGISEDSQSPLKAEPPTVTSLKATPPHGHSSSSSSSSSSSISIYPSSTDVLKACR